MMVFCIRRIISLEVHVPGDGSRPDERWIKAIGEDPENSSVPGRARAADAAGRRSRIRRFFA